MKIGGLQKLSLLDYPGVVACTVFTFGCNYRCPFCHNSALVTGASAPPRVAEEELFSFLAKRKKVLAGVAVTGGEPLLQPDLADFLRRVRGLGYRIKLDTNGSFPDRLEAIVKEGLVDAVAMDVKNSKEKYALTAGKADVDVGAVDASVRFLLSGAVAAEFRTTVAAELHTADDIRAIGRWIRGAERYFLQNYRESPSVIRPVFSPVPERDLQTFLAAARESVPAAAIRGE